MASGNVGIVRALFRAMDSIKGPAAGEMEALVKTYFHPDVVYREDPSWPGADEFHGGDALTAHFGEYLDFLFLESIELDDVIEGPEHLVALWTLRASGSGSGAPAEQSWAWVIEMKKGYVHRFSAHLDRAEALRLAGVEP